MAIINAPQIIDIMYDDKRHWFEVRRYTTSQELLTALLQEGIEVDPHTVAYTDNYPQGEECGRMYLLDSSVDTLAHEATHMALGILARHGNTSLVVTTDDEPELSHDLCRIVGLLTGKLYSHSKYY